MSGLATEFNELDRQYRAIFGEGIPLMQLPDDDERAAELVRQAIAERSTRVIDELIPPDAQT